MDMAAKNGSLKKWIRRGMFVWAAACFAVMGAGVSLAEERERIEDISLHIETGIEVGNSSWAVDVTTDDDTYSVDGAEILNSVGEWAGGMVPKIEIILTAEDGYYFSRTGSSAFSLSGEGAEYVSASREDDNTVMNLVIRLDALDEQDLSISSAWWNKRDGSAEWERTSGAKYYQLRLYRGDSLVTSVSTRSGSDCQYSFSGSMGSTGKYRFEVRAVGAGSSKGDWESSDSWSLSASDSSGLRSGSVSGYSSYDDYEDDRVFNTSNSAYSEDDEGDDEGPGDDDYGSSGGPGVSSSSGKKSSVSSSTGPGSTSSMTSGAPGTSGTAGSSSVSGTSSSSSGQTSTVSTSIRGTTKDSYSSGKSASGGITSDSQNCWYKDEGGWWYHLENGKYPYNTWELIDGQWYCFGEAGYRYHGWVEDGGQWYFCDLESGAMLVNTQTPDGCYVGSDGVWVH